MAQVAIPSPERRRWFAPFLLNFCGKTYYHANILNNLNEMSREVKERTILDKFTEDFVNVVKKK